MIHILILPSWYPKSSSDVSGVFFRDQALALLDYGHKVGVIAPQMKSLRTLLSKSKKAASPKFELDGGVPTYREASYAYLPGVPYGNYWLFKRLAKKLIKRYIAEQGRPDIIHAHSAIFAGAAAVELSNELQIPFVLTEHSSGFARKLYSPWQMKLAEKSFKHAKSCIAVSPELGKLLGRQLPITKDNWIWIPNVVADRFNEPAMKDKNSRPIRFFNLALMTQNKGQADLLNAFKLAIDNDLQAELWLGGDGPIRTTLEQQAKDLSISERVRFLGMVAPAKVPRLLEEVDVMVVSSHYESFGIVAAEALMAGVPVIATRCGGPECIVTDKNGMLVPIKNPQALSHAMLQLAQDIDRYDPVEISKFAKAKFSSWAIAGQLTNIYQQVLNGQINSPIQSEFK